MAGTYEVYLCDDGGRIITRVNDFLSLRANRVMNGIGAFSLSLPKTFDRNLIKADRMVQVWRKPQGGVLSIWRPYFHTRWEYIQEGDRE